VESVATVLRLPAAEVYTLGDGVGRLRATETAVLHVRIRGIRLSDNFVPRGRPSARALMPADGVWGHRKRAGREAPEHWTGPQIVLFDPPPGSQ